MDRNPSRHQLPEITSVTPPVSGELPPDSSPVPGSLSSTSKTPVLMAVFAAVKFFYMLFSNLLCCVMGGAVAPCWREEKATLIAACLSWCLTSWSKKMNWVNKHHHMDARMLARETSARTKQLQGHVRMIPRKPTRRPLWHHRGPTARPWRV